MFSFAGFFEPNKPRFSSDNICHDKLMQMMNSLCHSDREEIRPLITDDFCAGIVHCHEGCKPYSLCVGDRCCDIVFDGDIFNCNELRSLLPHSLQSENQSREEIVLLGFMEYGFSFVEKLVGNFSFAIFDRRHHTLYLFRDHFGSKPLFYSECDPFFIFASEPKAILAFREETPSVSAEGLNELFSIGPARTPGKAIYDHIKEVRPGHCLTVNKYGICETAYWKLQCRPHTENYEETVHHTRELLDEIFDGQFAVDPEPVCLLSGGIDSSLVAAYLKKETDRRGQRLVTISFDFAQNDKFFKSSSFQPSQDRPYIDAMVKHLQSRHHYLECNYQTLAEHLQESVLAHDMPCMADIDSSLLYFSKQVREIGATAYTGECADEVFGGYPWVHNNDLVCEDNFPWSPDLNPRKMLLKKEITEVLAMDSYVRNTYHNSVKSIIVLPEESDVDARKRRFSFLNLYWFMETLLNRMDRSCRRTGLTARIPFADHRLAEYVYNVPWDMKTRGGLVKALLRQAGEPMLPQQVLLRKKSPFPKTYHPFYEKMLTGMLSEVWNDETSVLHTLIEEDSLKAFLSSPKDLGTPWYGQLMCGPQMIAYLLQIDFWFKKYNIKLHL